ncbi:MAG: hypothetical protein R2752_00765 [Vicinamibacterales bacterium]
MRPRTRALVVSAAMFAAAVAPTLGQGPGREPDHARSPERVARQAQGQAPPAPQTPRAVFRATTDLVTIPVFVKGDADTVAGLTAADFVLTDNGVAQSVEMIDSESLPVDVSVIVETSRALENYASDVHEQVRRIAGMVRPGDRLEVLGVGDYVTVLVPFGPPGRVEALPQPASQGLTSINDALVAALVREPDPDRRHLVIALTDSIDTRSTVDVDTVLEVARQSNATLVVSWITLSIDDQAREPPGEPPPWIASYEKLARHVNLLPCHACGGPGALLRQRPRGQPWMPHKAPPLPRTIYAFDAVKEATELTGGGLYPPGIFVNRNASVIFDKVYADFRRNVVLRYRPEGVERVGWHDVTVTVPDHRGLDVRPRRGYLVEAEAPGAKSASGAAAQPVDAGAPTSTRPSSPAAPAPATATARLPGSLDALVAAASPGTLDAARAVVAEAAVDPDRLAALILAFRDAGNLWPSEPRREFVLALMLAGAAAESGSDRVRMLGVDLLGRYERLVRSPLGLDDYERDWLLAEAAVLEGAMRPAETLPRIRAALARFPDDARLLLARAVLADQLTAVPPDSGGRALGETAVAQLIGYYDAVPAASAVSDEARIRKSWLLRRLGRDADADAALAGVEPRETTLAGWRDLVATQPANAGGSDPAWQAYWRADFRVLSELVTALWP